MTEQEKKRILEQIDKSIKRKEYESRDFNTLICKFNIFDENQLNLIIKRLKNDIKDREIIEIEISYSFKYKDKIRD